VLAVRAIRAGTLAFQRFKVYLGLVFICANHICINEIAYFDALVNIVNVALPTPDYFFSVNAFLFKLEETKGFLSCQKALLSAQRKGFMGSARP